MAHGYWYPNSEDICVATGEFSIIEGTAKQMRLKGTVLTFPIRSEPMDLMCIKSGTFLFCQKVRFERTLGVFSGCLITTLLKEMKMLDTVKDINRT